MIHGMQPLLLPQRGVLRWVEEACEVVVEARRDHAGATEDPVKRTGVHAQPLLPEEERDRAAASQGDDVLEGLRCLGKPRAEVAGLLLRHPNFSQLETNYEECMWGGKQPSISSLLIWPYAVCTSQSTVSYTGRVQQV